ncbi:MAG TPA: hypothetical protein VFD58_12320 [Blastocatellia bacterium]|nr:hypothetical protein [Blastocatellia bacterium]
MSNFNQHRTQLIYLMLAMIVAGFTGPAAGTLNLSPAPPEAAVAATAAPAQEEPALHTILGQVNDTFGRGVFGVIVSLEGPNNLKLYSSTSRTGTFVFSGIPAGGPYKISAPIDVFRYSQIRGRYPNPGWYTIYNLTSRLDNINFIYNLTSPWVPPPDPNPGSGGGGGGGTGGGGGPGITPGGPPVDGTIQNPSFEGNVSSWQTNGIIQTARGTGVTDGGTAAKLLPTSNYVPASLTQFVQLTPGATYEVTADFTVSDSAARGSIAIKWGNGEDGPVALYNGGLNKTVHLQFTVPAGVTQVGFQARATGSAGKYVIVDNFTLKRLT